MTLEVGREFFWTLHFDFEANQLVTPLPFVDLFCGAGGLSAGFEKAGFKAVFANDIDPFATHTFSINHPDAAVFSGDIEELTARAIREGAGIDSIPLIVGGPNCQGVSLRGKRDPGDPKNRMFFHFKRLIAELQPDWFVLENVPGLMHRHNRELVTSIFEAFESIGYRCGAEVLLAADYGVPQLRYRFILIGNRHGLPIEFPEPTHACSIDFDEDTELFPPQAIALPGWRSVADALSDLPPLENGGGSDEVAYPPRRGSEISEFQRYCREGGVRLLNHRSHKSPAANIALIRHIGPGKNWKAIPESLRPPRFRHVALKDHTTTFGRLRWDMPARTITTYFNNISAGAFTHPEQDRGITVREGARLQAFSDTFRFVGPLSRQYRQVGNAVPPLMAYHIAEQIRKNLASDAGTMRTTHSAAIEYSRRTGRLLVNRPLKGMRFNLDRYLVRK